MVVIVCYCVAMIVWRVDVFTSLSISKFDGVSAGPA